MNLPAISVLVPTYNRVAYLPQCLDSIFKQTLPPFEVIVIDDGSTDGTSELLRSYGSRIIPLAKPNGGKSRTLNMGLEAVRGDYVWIMDDDDVALPHALEHLVAPLVANPAAEMTFADCNMAGMRPDGTLDLPGITRFMPDFPDADLFHALLKWGCFLGQSAVLARTATYRRAGPFDDHLVRALDWDMHLRLSFHCQAVRVPGTVFIYRQHPGARGSAEDRFDSAERTGKWRSYGKVVALKVRGYTPVEDYIPRSSRPPALLPPQLRPAYLQRQR